MTPTVPGQFESVEQAQRVREILNAAWWHAYQKKDAHPEEYRLAQSALQRIKEEAIRQFAKADKSYPDPNCKSCREYSVFGGPRHGNSIFCQSGKRPHCTCDMCF